MFRLASRSPCKSALQKRLQKSSCRQYSNSNCSPQNFQEAGFGKIIVFLTPLAAIGGTITYAKYDKDFRKRVEQNVPGAEYIIKVALQEEKPFQAVSQQIDGVKKQFDSVAKTIEGATATVTGLFGSSHNNAAKKTEDDKIQISVQKNVSSVSSKPANVKPVTKIEASKPKSVEPLPSDVVELEHAVEHAAELAVKEYNKAIEILKGFNNDVRRIVDVAIENVDTSLWTTLKNKSGARDSSVETAEQLAREAMEKIEKCEVALAMAAKPDNHDQIITIRNKIKKIVDHIHNVKDELYKNKDIASISEKYWRNVEKARNYFIDEIESIFPGLNLAEQKLKLSQEDLDLFVTHAYSHVVTLQKELERLQTDGELRLKRAIDALRGDNDSEAVKAQLEYLLEAEKRKLAIENQKKIFQIRADAEKQLRLQLKQQAEAHFDHIKDAVTSKENEMRRNFSKELEEKLATETANYKLQLAAMLGKLRGMDAALQARAESERSAHQAQALWAACQALWATVRTGEPGEHWKTKLRPLENEIKAIARVAEGDELVGVVIQNLPREAQQRGVYPEDALRERFLNVERIARKLALIPEEGASLPKYFLSYLQSLLILTPDDPISQDELQNKAFDFSKLDTYDILNRARYFVDRGDLTMALKYANLLQGAPRKIASDWLKETRLLLETQQAANILMAHAAASGLLYL